MPFFSRPSTIRHLFEASSIQDEIITLIRQAKSSLKIAVTWFTNHDLFNELIQKLQEPDFQITLIVLNDRINNKNEGVDFQKLIVPNGKFYYSDKTSMVHHKFCIVDDKIVLTGSYNWTYPAEDNNWENVIVIYDQNVVNDYVNEFKRVIDNHEHNKVDNVLSKRKFDIAFADEYLKADYILQAAREEKKGNSLIAAKVYTEVLKIDSNQHQVVEARNAILSRYNGSTFNVAPCEIGILFSDGYKAAVPAFKSLPFTSEPLIGYTTSSTASNFNVTIQKSDFKISTKTFEFNNLLPQPQHTAIIEYILHLDTSGILTVHCRELGGYGRKKSEPIDLKAWS